MRHRTHAFRHALTDARPLRRLRANIALIGVSLLVPVVGLAALAVPSRVAQDIAAPLWNAVAAPLEQLPTKRIVAARPEASIGPAGRGETGARRVHATLAPGGTGAFEGADGGREDDGPENQAPESGGGDATGPGFDAEPNEPPGSSAGGGSPGPGNDSDPGDGQGHDETNPPGDEKDPRGPSEGGGSTGTGDDCPDDEDRPGRGKAYAYAKGLVDGLGGGNGNGHGHDQKPRHGGGDGSGGANENLPTGRDGNEREEANRDGRDGGAVENGLGHVHHAPVALDRALGTRA